MARAVAGARTRVGPRTRTRARARARMSVRVRARQGLRHPLHYGCRRRQLKSEALSRHDALGHYDVHDTLRRVDLHLT